MSQLISGAGRFDFTNLNSSLPEFFFVEPVEFKINGDSKKVESRKLVEGKNVRAGSKILQEDYTMTVTIEAASYTAMQVALGKKSAKVDAALPEVRYKAVPTTGAFEFVDADLGAALGVQAFVTEAGAWGDEGPLTLLATGTPATGQFRVDGTNNKLIFNAAQAGAPIAYRLIKSYLQIDSIGVDATAKALTQFSFSGLGYTDTGEFYKVVVPKMNLAKVPSLAFDEVTKFELEYDLAVASGFSTAYQMYRMPNNYQPG
jgi:hypothetical protein